MIDKEYIDAQWKAVSAARGRLLEATTKAFGPRRAKAILERVGSSVSRMSDDELATIAPHQFDAHVSAYLEDLIDRTEAESVAHVFGTYF